MSQQLLRDPNVSPTPQLIAEGLGKTNTVYLKFLHELSQREIVVRPWRFYNDGQAWLTKGEHHWTSVRGTAKVKPLFWLSIWDGLFKVSFFFATKLRSELLNLPLSADTKRIIKTTQTMGNVMRFMGIVLDITKAEQLDDIFTLAQFRKTKT